MDVILERCAGLDVHQATVAVAVRLHGAAGREQLLKTFGATTPDLLALRDWLTALGVTHVARAGDVVSYVYLRTKDPMGPPVGYQIELSPRSFGRG